MTWRRNYRVILVSRGVSQLYTLVEWWWCGILDREARSLQYWFHQWRSVLLLLPRSGKFQEPKMIFLHQFFPQYQSERISNKRVRLRECFQNSLTSRQRNYGTIFQEHFVLPLGQQSHQMFVKQCTPYILFRTIKWLYYFIFASNWWHFWVFYSLKVYKNLTLFKRNEVRYISSIKIDSNNILQ